MYPASEIPLLVFLALVLIQLLLGIESLRSGFRFSRYVRKALGREYPSDPSPVTVFVPCKGDEPGLAANLQAILAQDHKDFETLFIVEDNADPAVEIIERLIDKDSKIIVAGKATDSGQKVHNLVVAVKSARAESEIFAFADSDARPSSSWLSDLTKPVDGDERVVCASGYRWFINGSGGFASRIRAVWNASITSALGRDRESNFCWGGSTAIRRKAFENIGVISAWKGTLSDDFVLTKCLKEHGHGVYFEPRCLLPTMAETSFSEMLEFTNRQMKITKTYSPNHFKISLLGSGLFSLTFFPGLLFSVIIQGWIGLAIALTVSGIWVLGSLKAGLRLRTVARCIPAYDREIKRQLLAHLLLWPFGSLLFFINSVSALASNRITWRGISYELVSDKEIKIIR